MRPPTVPVTLLLIPLLSILPVSWPVPVSSARRSPRFLGDFAFSRPDPSRRPKAAYQYETRYFRQRLDHFSFAELPSFQQRYLVGPSDHWALPAGPIFFYCGNEGDIEWFASNTGFVWEIAPLFSALVVFAEVYIFITSNFSSFTEINFQKSRHYF